MADDADANAAIPFPEPEPLDDDDIDGEQIVIPRKRDENTADGEGD